MDLDSSVFAAIYINDALSEIRNDIMLASSVGLPHRLSGQLCAGTRISAC